MVGPHEDTSVTLWSTKQCVTFWISAALWPAVTMAVLGAVRVSVLCERLWEQRKGQSHLSLAASHVWYWNWWQIYEVSACALVHMCWLVRGWCHARERLLRAPCEASCAPQTFAVCWQRERGMCVRARARVFFIAFLGCLLQTTRKRSHSDSIVHACHPPSWRPPPACVRAWSPVCVRFALFSLRATDVLPRRSVRKLEM